MEPFGSCLGVTQCLLAQNLAIFPVQLPSQRDVLSDSQKQHNNKLVSNVSEDAVIETLAIGYSYVGLCEGGTA